MDPSQRSPDRYRADSQSLLSSRLASPLFVPIGWAPCGLAAASSSHRNVFGYVAITAGRRAHGCHAGSRAARPASRAPHRVELGGHWRAPRASGRLAFALKLALVVLALPRSGRKGRARGSWWRRATAMRSASSERPARPRLQNRRSLGAPPGVRRSRNTAREPSPPARLGNGTTVRLLHSASACGR